MNNSDELYINHEVRVRLMEEEFKKVDARFEKVDARFEKIEKKMDSHFFWILGIIITLFISMVTLFGGMFLSIAKIA